MEAITNLHWLAVAVPVVIAEIVVTWGFFAVRNLLKGRRKWWLVCRRR